MLIHTSHEATVLGRVARRLALALLLPLAVSANAGSLGCGAGQARPESVLKPLEERRARAVIERAVMDNGERPTKGRVVVIGGGTDLTEDLALQGGPYGIAYITMREEGLLGKALPEHRGADQQLRLMRGSGGAIVLLLYETDYRYDAGGKHSTTVVTAERKLTRDVADFVLHVVRQHKNR